MQPGLQPQSVPHVSPVGGHRRTAGLLQFWAPDVDVADTTMDTAAQGAVAVSALWLWAALAEKPQEVLAELVATGETWRDGGPGWVDG